MNHDDHNIPLLTEIIPVAPQVLPQQSIPMPPAYVAQADAGAPDYASAPQPGAFWQAPESANYQPPAQSFAPEPFSPVAEQYRNWEQEIRENVLQNLLAQADTVVQQHLRDQLALTMDNLGDILTQRIKEGLRQALAETVTRAVAEEMARFTSSKNQS
ncbi:hypothetical protein [Herbaspirillum sp. YR522]|uniref:hypothetical protein n=1 Tax=Herbaspirillum sp. YR522 TaxID=1144342 RepID=UPI00026FBBBD|nr:hypothetical protein [Herbaspirillum sp. YR522]EJN09539.1 hypothetical protein PMI40_00547 [Herbaspirillum sp. YR522]